MGSAKERSFWRLFGFGIGCSVSPPGSRVRGNDGLCCKGLPIARGRTLRPPEVVFDADYVVFA